MLLALSSLYWATPTTTASVSPTVGAPPAIVQVVAPVIGTQSDALRRLQALVPASWFKSPDPEVSGVLNGVAANEAYLYSAIQYLRAQSRLQSTSDGFLDIAAWDFFGSGFLRRVGENDASFSVRLIAELTRPRLTRASIISALKSLTGNTPSFFEPWNTGDTGGIGTSYFAFAGNNAGAVNGGGFGGFGLNSNNGCYYVAPSTPTTSTGAGAIGSLVTPYQFFVTMPRPGQQGVPNISGFNSSGGGFGKGAFALITPSMIVAPVSDQNVYDTINATKAAGTTCWIDLTGTAYQQSDLSSDWNSDWGYSPASALSWSSGALSIPSAPDSYDPGFSSDFS